MSTALKFVCTLGSVFFNFVVFGLIFSVPHQEIGWEELNVSEMTYFV